MMEVERIGRILDWENELVQRIQVALCNPQVDWPEVSDGSGQFLIPDIMRDAVVTESPLSEKGETVVETDSLAKARAESVIQRDVDRVLSAGGDDSFLQESQVEPGLSERKVDVAEEDEIHTDRLDALPADMILNRVYHPDREWDSQSGENLDAVYRSLSVETASEDGTTMNWDAAEALLFREGMAGGAESLGPETRFSGRTGSETDFFDSTDSTYNELSNDFFSESSGEDFSRRISDAEPLSGKAEPNRNEGTNSDSTFRSGLTEKEMNQVLDYIIRMLEEAVLTEAEGYYSL